MPDTVNLPHYNIWSELGADEQGSGSESAVDNFLSIRSYPLPSAKWQKKKFRVSAGFHQFPSFPKPRNPETNYFLDYLLNHRWTVSIDFHSSSFLSFQNRTWIAKFPSFLIFQRLPRWEPRGSWNAKVLMAQCACNMSRIVRGLQLVLLDTFFYNNARYRKPSLLQIMV